MPRKMIHERCLLMVALLFAFATFAMMPTTDAAEDSAPDEQGETETTPTHILYLGDSTIITGYLPAKLRIGHQLEQQMNEQNIITHNHARGGQCITNLFGTGHYEKARSEVPTADIIIVRYGQNDQKRLSPDQFADNLRFLVKQLHKDFPDAQLFLDTGLYFDPDHMGFDRNKKLDPYWQKTRDVAAEMNVPLIDTYAAMKRESDAGNWDLRIRTRKVWDDRLDDENRDNPQWFSNGHPNPAGVRVAAEAHAKAIKSYFEGALPHGGKKTAREPIRNAQWLEMMGLEAKHMLNRQDRKDRKK